MLDIDNVSKDFEKNLFRKYLAQIMFQWKFQSFIVAFNKHIHL